MADNKVKEILAKGNYKFDDLYEIMKILRSESGCPWDREQDHKSIRNNLIEEVYETIEAIDKDNTEMLREELGDVLLQIVFHSVIGEEANKFDIDGVCDEICKKLIRRHPHIFGDISVKDSEEVLKNWDEIKNGEKQLQSESELLKSVSNALPSLMRTEKIIKKAAKNNIEIPGLREDVSKLTAYFESNNIDPDERAIGRILSAVSAFCVERNICTEEVLFKYNDEITENI